MGYPNAPPSLTNSIIKEYLGSFKQFNYWLFHCHIPDPKAWSAAKSWGTYYTYVPFVRAWFFVHLPSKFFPWSSILCPIYITTTKINAWAPAPNSRGFPFLKHKTVQKKGTPWRIQAQIQGRCHQVALQPWEQPQAASPVALSCRQQLWLHQLLPDRIEPPNIAPVEPGIEPSWAGGSGTCTPVKKNNRPGEFASCQPPHKSKNKETTIRKITLLRVIPTLTIILIKSRDPHMAGGE
jgi:hypothetical protein